MGIHLSGVVAGIASLPALAAFIFKKSIPLPGLFLLWHVAGTGFVVSIATSTAFASSSTWILGKRKDGTIAPAAALLFWPYHVGLRTKLFIQRRVSTEPAYNKITPIYYLGGWPSEEALTPSVHPAILDVTCELPLQAKPPAYKMIPVWDTHSPTPDQIDSGVEWALEQERRGVPVLIHCAHGHGRSATMLCAILLSKGEASTIAEAEAILKRERPRVRLNSRQRQSLIAWFTTRAHKKN